MGLAVSTEEQDVRDYLLERVRAATRGKQIMLFGGNPSEEKRRSLEELLAAARVVWPECRRTGSPRKHLGLLQRSDILLMFERFMSHGNAELAQEATKLGKQVVWLWKGLGENRILTELAARLTPAEEDEMKSLNSSNAPKNGIVKIIGASEERVQIPSGLFSLKEMDERFHLLLRLSRSNSDKARTVIREFMLRGIDPRLDPHLKETVTQEIAQKASCSRSYVQVLRKRIHDNYRRGEAEIEQELAREVLADPAPAPVATTPAPEESMSHPTRDMEELLKVAELESRELKELKAKASEMEAALALAEQELARYRQELAQAQQAPPPAPAAPPAPTPSAPLSEQAFLDALDLIRQGAVREWENRPLVEKEAILWQAQEVLRVFPRA